MGTDHRDGKIRYNLSTMLCLYIWHFKWSHCLICKYFAAWCAFSKWNFHAESSNQPWFTKLAASVVLVQDGGKYGGEHFGGVEITIQLSSTYTALWGRWRVNLTNQNLSLTCLRKIWWHEDMVKIWQCDNGSDNDNDSPPKPPVIQMREMCRTKREAKHLFLKNPIDSFLLDNSIDAGDPIWRFFHTSISPTPSFSQQSCYNFWTMFFGACPSQTAGTQLSPNVGV